MTTTQERPSLAASLKAALRRTRAYAAFFVALALVELLYGVVFWSAATDISTVRREVSESYDYEMVYRSMTHAQYSSLYNRCGEAPEEHTFAPSYRAVRYEKIGNYEDPEDNRYNAYVTLRGSNLRRAAKRFDRSYPVKGIEPSYSPLYNFRAQYVPSIVWFTILCTLGVFALSLFLLVRLYRLLLDRDTFEFGIHMAVGATSRHLYHRAARELLLIGAAVALPAFLLSFGATALLYVPVGVSVPFAVWSLPLTLLCTGATVLCAVYFPMRALAKVPPTQLLHAKDTTPYVTSPRRSFRMRSRAFARTFELISLWRFRRYYAALALATVLLPVLFVLTSSLSGILQDYRSASKPDFTVSFSPEVVNDAALIESTADITSTLSEIDGVGLCLPEQILSKATRRKGHMLLHEDDVHASSAATVRHYPTKNTPDIAKPYTHATNLYEYAALDAAAITALGAQYSDIEGDLASVLNDDHTIVITASVANEQPLALSVGDTVLLVVHAEDTVASLWGVTDQLELLSYQMEDGIFTYEEFTVGAIIHDLRGDATLTVGLNFDAYTRLTAQTPTRSFVDVYFEDGIGFDVWKNASESIYDAAFSYYNCTAHDHQVFFERYLTSLRNLNGRLEALAWGLCLMALLICFYSQMTFYDKRNSEWLLLRSLGVRARTLRRTLAIATGIPAVLSLGLTLLLSLSADALLWNLLNRWLPAGGFIDRLTTTHTIPWVSIALALLVSLVCSTAPTLIALCSLRKNQHQTIGGYLNVSEKE